MKNFLRSKGINIVLWVLGGLVILFLVFGAGMAVGYRSGLFASRFGQNYYHNFLGVDPNDVVRGGLIGGPMPIIQHGAIGIVISVGSSTIATKDPNGNEQSVAIDSSTMIREANQTVSISSIQDGSHVAVIGEPNDTGQIHARFIRIFDADSLISNTPDNQ